MKHKTILITGGTTGIGLATAQLLAAEGAKVIVTGRNPETLEAARKASPAGVVVIKSDSGSQDDALALGAEVKKHAASIDGAFLNAGIGTFIPFEGTTPASYDAMFNVNVRGLYFQLQSLVPVLANPSAVVFTSSVAATEALPASSVYSATKAAVVSLGKTLAVELAPRGIRVNVVSPGPIATPILGKLGLDAEAQKHLEDDLSSKTLLKRIGASEEVARTVRFLLSEDSSFIVGADIVVDGGMKLS